MNLRKIWAVLSNPKVSIPLESLAALIIIFDAITKRIGLVIPTIRFLWMIMKLKVPIFIIVFSALLVLIVIILWSRHLNEKPLFIISMVDKGERDIWLLFRAYKKRFPNDDRTMSSCITTIKRLEKKKLVKWVGNGGGMQDVQDELFKLTKKGLNRFDKLDLVIKEKAQRILDEIANDGRERKAGKGVMQWIEPHEEIMFFLKILGNEDGYLEKTDLRSRYFKKYTDKEESDFKIVWSKLEGDHMIREDRGPTGYASTGRYTIEDKGLEYFSIYKDRK